MRLRYLLLSLIFQWQYTGKVPLKRKIVLKECAIGVITIFAYYSENRTIQVLILIIASVHFFIDNRNFILFALKKAMNMWKGIRGENE